MTSSDDDRYFLYRHFCCRPAAHHRRSSSGWRAAISTMSPRIATEVPAAFASRSASPRTRRPPTTPAPRRNWAWSLSCSTPCCCWPSPWVAASSGCATGRRATFSGAAGAGHRHHRRGAVAAIRAGICRSTCTAPSCIEARFGFNKMTLELYLRRCCSSSLLLGAALGLPLLLGVLWLMERMGELVVAVRMAGLGRVQPAAAVHLPHAASRRCSTSSRRCRRQPLKARIEALLHEVRLHRAGPVRDGRLASAAATATPISPASARPSASCSSTPCCSASTPDEIEAVLAHELGHFKRHHVIKRIALHLRRQPGLPVAAGAADARRHGSTAAWA